MKLIVQIPCYNEESTLPLVVNSIPKRIDGIDKIEIMVIDDSSKDNTSEIAKKLGELIHPAFASPEIARPNVSSAP